MAELVHVVTARDRITAIACRMLVKRGNDDHSGRRTTICARRA